jgi:hypothetical protein
VLELAMSLMPEWTQSKAHFEQTTKPAAGQKDEKPLATFKQKSLKGVEATIKSIDAAIAKPDAKALAKKEAELHKKLLDLHTAGQTALGQMKTLNGNRAAVFEHALKVIQSQLQELKGEVAESIARLKTPGAQAATQVVPAQLFDLIRRTAVTRDPEVIKFTNAREYGSSSVDGKTALAAAAKEQATFKHCYEAYTQMLALVDHLKSSTATADQIAGQLRIAFDKIEEQLNLMSMALVDWESAQMRALQAVHLAKPPKPAEPLWAHVKHVNGVVSDESKRLIQLRESVKKLFPSHFR